MDYLVSGIDKLDSLVGDGQYYGGDLLHLFCRLLRERKRGGEISRQSPTLTFMRPHHTLTEICFIQTQTHTKLFTHNALQYSAITQIESHLMRQVKRDKITLCTVKNVTLLGLNVDDVDDLYIPHVVLLGIKKVLADLAGFPLWSASGNQAVKCPKPL